LFYDWVNSETNAFHPIFCIGFNFPKTVDFTSFEFKNSIYFSHAKFKDANFSEAKFKDANFSEAKFTGIADFAYAEFRGIADFAHAEFRGKTYFEAATFTGEEANFLHAKFTGEEADFLHAKFTGRKADFTGAEFVGIAYFEAKFEAEVSFSNARFKREAYFSHAEFTGIADFANAVLQGIIQFINTDFKEEVNFNETKFVSFERGYAAKHLISWDELLEYPHNIELDKKLQLRMDGLYLPLGSGKTGKNGTQITITPSDENEDSVLLTLHKRRKNVEVKRVQEDQVHKFPTREDESGKIVIVKPIIPIKFDYSTFRKRVRFIGDSSSPLQLKSVSLKGVDLSQVEFHNVEWLKKK
jgi:uncharacterized protein YjbI with pentapeptide repeats